MLRIPLYVDIITENTELIITTKNIAKSFSPISKIAKGTQAMLGNDCNPTAKELIVLPNPGIFTITNPTAIPIMMDIVNAITSRYIVIPTLLINVKSWSKPAKDSATIAGEGIDTCGHIPKMYTSCHIPINAAINNVILAKSSRPNLLPSSLVICCCRIFCISN